MKDFTAYYERADGCWALKPHSGRADAMLAREFAALGDVDLTLSDVCAIIVRARASGMVVVDVLGRQFL